MKPETPIVKINNMVKLFTANDMVVRAASDNGLFEHETFSYWLKYLKPNEIALDVGAYTGLYSIAAYMHGCEVHAFEPNDLVYSRLCDNIELNHAYGIQTHIQACSDKHGMMNFIKKPIPLTSAGHIGDEAKGIPVGCRRLDSFFQTGDRSKVCAIKIDVEGHEPNVIHGASKIIENSHPLVIGEFLVEEQKDGLIELMKTFGYDKFTVCDDRNLVCEP